MGMGRVNIKWKWGRQLAEMAVWFSFCGWRVIRPTYLNHRSALAHWSAADFGPAVAGRLWRWYCSVIRTHSHRQAHLAGQLTKATASLWLAAATAERQRHLAAFDFFLFYFLVCVCVWVCVLPMCRLLRGCLSVSSLHVSRISSARIEPDSRISCRAIPIGWLRLPEIPLFRWDRHLSLWRMEAFLSLLVRFVLLDLLPNFQINWKNKFQFTRDQDKGQCCYSNGLSKSN